MLTFQYPIRVPSDLLQSLGEFTRQCWSDSIRNHLRPAAAAQNP